MGEWDMQFPVVMVFIITLTNRWVWATWTSWNVQELAQRTCFTPEAVSEVCTVLFSNMNLNICCHLRMQRGNVFNHICLCVCLSVMFF